jgi:hypothetical protein
LLKMGSKMMQAINKMGKMNFELTYGVLNLDGGAVGSIRNLSTPPHTSIKANSVPAEQISVTMFISTKNMGIATKKPVKTVEKEGVLYLGCILEKALGNKPSRLMLIQMRGCPN